MRRREFLVFCGGIGAAWPLAVDAQEKGQIPRLGLLSPFPRNSLVNDLFFDELRKLGYEEGRNVVVEFQQFGNDVSSMQAGAAELVRANVDLILTEGPGEAALQAVLALAKSLPVVVVAVNFDPLESRYVSSLARPGSNLTGVAMRLPELATKQVELAREAFPSSPLALLWDEFTADQFNAASKAAQARSLEVRALKLENRPYDFDAAFRTITAGAPATTLVLSSAYFFPLRTEIARAALQHRVPTMFYNRRYVEAGGLMSYGPDTVTMRRRAVTYVDRILRGAKPADLPFEQPTKWELTFNIKTAQALGLDIPQSLLARANEVIE